MKKRIGAAACLAALFLGMLSACAEPEERPEVSRPSEAQAQTQPQTAPTDVDEPGTKPTQPEPVGEDWYSDVLFIGDSRTVGLRDYARQGDADYFCKVGMSMFDYQAQELSDYGFSEQSLRSLLASKTYGKIFVGLGVNDCGRGTEELMEAFDELVELLQKYQPNAVILLEAVIMVSEEVANSNSVFNPQRIYAMNQGLSGMADGEKIFYIDANVVLADELGYLQWRYTSDGVHFNQKGYEAWADWISLTVAKLGLSESGQEGS